MEIVSEISRNQKSAKFRELSYREISYPPYTEFYHIVTLNSKSVTGIDNKLPDNLNGPVLPYRMISFTIVCKVQEVME